MNHRNEIDKIFDEFLGHYIAVDDDTGEVDYRYWKEKDSFWDAQENELNRFKKKLEARITKIERKARIDELESNRNLLGFDIGAIHMTTDQVNDRIEELSNKEKS